MCLLLVARSQKSLPHNPPFLDNKKSILMTNIKNVFLVHFTCDEISVSVKDIWCAIL